MGLGLRVKREVLLTKADSLALEKAARVKRRSQSSIIREALLEWLSARGLLHEEEEPEAPPAPTLGELLEMERQKRVLGNERHR
jgi:hypothetical protein